MTPQQRILLRRAKASHRPAKILSDQEFYDFAVSRAYYAMFYVAQALLLGEGMTFSKHSAVIAASGRHFAKTGRVPEEYHRYLIEGEHSRDTADYDMGPGLSADDASGQIGRAEEFLTLGEKLLGSSQDKDDTAS